MPYPSLTIDELAFRQRHARPGDVSAIKLRRLRTEAGIPVAEFAAKVGLSDRHYSNIEAAVKQPGSEARQRIAEALGCDEGDFLIGDAA